MLGTLYHSFIKNNVLFLTPSHKLFVISQKNNFKLTKHFYEKDNFGNWWYWFYRFTHNC